MLYDASSLRQVLAAADAGNEAMEIQRGGHGIQKWYLNRHSISAVPSSHIWVYCSLFMINTMPAHTHKHRLSIAAKQLAFAFARARTHVFTHPKTHTRARSRQPNFLHLNYTSIFTPFDLCAYGRKFARPECSRARARALHFYWHSSGSGSRSSSVCSGTPNYTHTKPSAHTVLHAVGGGGGGWGCVCVRSVAYIQHTWLDDGLCGEVHARMS